MGYLAIEFLALVACYWVRGVLTNYFNAGQFQLIGEETRNVEFINKALLAIGLDRSRGERNLKVDERGKTHLRRPPARIREKLPRLPKDLIHSLEWELVRSVREHDHPAVWNLSAEMFDFLLVISSLCFQKFQDVLSLWRGQGLSSVNILLVTDGEERKRRCLDFA